MHGRTVKILAHICWYHYCIYILIMHGSWIVEKYGLCSLSSVYVFTSTASEVKCDFDPSYFVIADVNPLNPEWNPICHLLALLGTHHFLHVSRIRVKLLTFRLLMPYIYIYMEHQFLMFLDHTQRRSTVGRTPLDEDKTMRKQTKLNR